MTGNLKCHFDADGWLQGPISITHVLTPNHSPSGFAQNGRGVVFHTEAGYEAGTVETFMNPASQVSAFFSIGQGGACHQYLPVGHGYCAWTQMAGNQAWRGVETEDRTDPSIPLTNAQLTAFAQILEACSAYDGFPLQITDDPVNGHGLITHGDGGEAWGGHFQCPGDARKAQRPQILALAMSIRQEKPLTAAPAAREWLTAGMSSLASLALQEHCTPAEILQLTAIHGPLPADVATYVNGVFAGTTDPKTPMPKGLALYLPG